MGWFDASEDAINANLRDHIESHPQIHCTGMVDATAPWYRSMDVMVLPTWREGFPNAVLEAQATAVPVIPTIATGSRDSVVPEVTGLLIPPGYPQAIAEAVLDLLRDPERRRRMGAAARAWVQERYETAAPVADSRFLPQHLGTSEPIAGSTGSREASRRNRAAHVGIGRRQSAAATLRAALPLDLLEYGTATRGIASRSVLPSAS